MHKAVAFYVNFTQYKRNVGARAEKTFFSHGEVCGCTLSPE